MKQIIISIFSLLSAIGVYGQATSFSFKAENPKYSKHEEDSIFNSNPLCQKYVEIAKSDTFYWNQYPSVTLDSIPLLYKKSANELFNQSLDFKHSGNYSNHPFNLLGTYYETEYKNDTNTFQNIKTKVKVFDEGFTSDNLIKTRTQQCDELFKSPDFHNSLFDSYMHGLGGNYSNLYYLLDLDFLRMFNTPYSDELGGDRRKWSKNKGSGYEKTDNYNYLKAFTKDSSTYVVLISEHDYCIFDQIQKRSSLKYINQGNSDPFPKDVQKVVKYVVINLNTNAIEETKYLQFSFRDSSSIFPNQAESYETSYYLKDGKYYLRKVHLNRFRFSPRIDDISLSGISFHVDSVVTAPGTVEKIKDSQADNRKENYFDQNLKRSKTKIKVE
jgi:hypothetical protein